MKKYILVLGVFVSVTTVRAQQLDLETCLKMADTANLTIRQALLNSKITSSERDAYLAARIPKVTFSGDYKYNALIPGQLLPAEIFGGPTGTYATVKFGVPFTLSNSVQLSQILYNPQLEYGLSALEINKQIVDIQTNMTLQDVKYQVANSYFNLQAVNKQLSFVNENMENMDLLIKNMEAMVNQKMLVKTEADKLKINKLTLENSRINLEATKNQLETYLKILIGKNVNEPISLVGDEVVQQTILIDNTQVKYPEIELLDAQKRMNEKERNGNNMAYLPSLSLYGVYNYTYNIKPENDFRTGINSAFVGLKLDWTLFDGLEKANKNKVIKMKADQISYQTEMAQLQLDMKSNNLKQQIEVQKSAIEIANVQLKLAQDVYQMTKSQFQEGMISSNDMIVADNSLQQAQTNLVASYVKLRQAELEYLKSIGSIE